MELLAPFVYFYRIWDMGVACPMCYFYKIGDMLFNYVLSISNLNS